ncbi:MAG: NAD(P)/FAD-dependent oxidoreductase [Xanthobacteraceae bacterium]
MLNPGSVLPRGEVDIAVIGAGAAGLAAARRLADAKFNFVVLEARSRVGGRAWTASHGGYLLDLGCGWLHSGDRNPWTRIAEAAGFTIDHTPAPWTREDSDLSFAEGEEEDFDAASGRFYERIAEASAKGLDISAASFLEPNGRWNPLLNAISTYANGAELELVSVSDSARYQDTGVNWRVVEGYGTAVAAHGAGLPVVLDCAVARIDHGGQRVRIETACGDVSARAIVVTVPTTLIASEAIRFTPALPDKVEAAAGLPLGLADKIVLALDRPEAVAAETRLFGRTDRTGIGAYHLRPFGRPLIEGFFGGRLARELEQEGEGALARFAIDELAAQLGSDVRPRLKPLVATAWSADRYARGSYSHALPGNAGARSILARPVDGRLFFAGEACSPESFSTAHGAYQTGIAAAEEAIAALAPRSLRAG